MDTDKAPHSYTVLFELGRNRISQCLTETFLWAKCNIGSMSLDGSRSKS